jgi:hypothetical protein
MARPEVTGRRPHVSADEADRASGPPSGDPEEVEPSLHEEPDEISALTPVQARALPVAYTIPEFCEAHRISVAFYYELKKIGRTPREIALGARRIITAEAAAEWRARETDASIAT